MIRLRLIATLAPIALLAGCITSDWDSTADLSMTDKDPWEYYSDVYLDYENGRLNVAVYEPSLPATGTAPQTGTSAAGKRLAVFFDDVHVSTHSLQTLKGTGTNINSLLFCDSQIPDKGPLKLDSLPEWIAVQLTPEERELFILAQAGDPQAQQQFAQIARSRIQTPWATGIDCIAQHYESGL